MKNVYDVLQQKEIEVSKLEIEVEALRVVAPLLTEERESEAENTQTDSSRLGDREKTWDIIWHPNQLVILTLCHPSSRP